MIALTAAALVVDAPRTASGEDEAACAVNDLGMLDDDMVGLSAVGTWTTEDCDSRFRIDSDAHTYRFQHAEGDRIRIDLVSAGGDPSWDRAGRPEVLGDSVRTTSREALCVPEASRSLAVDRAPAGSSGRATH